MMIFMIYSKEKNNQVTSSKIKILYEGTDLKIEYSTWHHC
jgi:hypothetical protein